MSRYNLYWVSNMSRYRNWSKPPGAVSRYKQGLTKEFVTVYKFLSGLMRVSRLYKHLNFNSVQKLNAKIVTKKLPLPSVLGTVLFIRAVGYLS